jgi:hypothetical protein
MNILLPFVISIAATAITANPSRPVLMLAVIRFSNASIRRWEMGNGYIVAAVAD